MKKKGFTLVELLIVIAVIAVLMLLGATNWIAQQQKARDARRKADLTQIQAALEMYRTDHATYPDNANWIVDLGPYMSPNPVPVDPKSGVEYTYIPDSELQSYTLTATDEQMEREGRYLVYSP